MIKFADIPKLLKELNTPHVVIRDTNDQKIFDISNKSVEPTIKKLEELKNVLKSYGRIYISAADDNIVKGRWKGAYCWEVAFSDDASPAIGAQPVTANPAATEQVHKLEMKLKEMEWEKKQDEKLKALEEKFDKKNKGNFNPAMLIPIVGEVLGMDSTKVDKYMKIFAGSDTYTPPATSLAGQATKLTREMTPEEQEKMQTAINTEIEKIFNKTGAEKIHTLMAELNKLHEKTSPDTIIELISGLNKNPKYIEMALNFIKM